jgi:predicted acetyltransferase
MYYAELTKSASSIKEADRILHDIYKEDPSHWPNGLTSHHFDGGLYLVRDSDTQKAAGFVGWQERHDGMHKVGYYSVGIKPEYRRRGFAKEAISKLLKEKSAGVDKVRALVVSTNTPSKKLADAVGVPVIENDRHTKAASQDGALSTRTKDLETKIKSLVERYSVPRPWFHFGVGDEKVPGTDIVGQKMDEDYFKRGGKAKGVMTKHDGPDHFGLYPSVIDDSLGTLYRKDPNTYAGTEWGHLGGVGGLRSKKANLMGGLGTLSMEKQAWAKYINNPLTRFLGLGGVGAGTGYLEGEALGFDDKHKHLNALLNAATFMVGGNRWGKGGTKADLANPGKWSGAAALQWPLKTGLINYSNTAAEGHRQQKALSDQRLAAALAEERAANNTLWQDIKRWAGKNKGKAWGLGVGTVGIGAGLLGSMIYRNMKGQEDGEITIGKPGVVNVEVPKDKISDSFYRSLSRDLLFKDKELNEERDDADVSKRKQDARQRRLKTKEKKLAV